MKGVHLVDGASARSNLVFTEMNVCDEGERALKTGGWEQPQAAITGESRVIAGRATSYGKSSRRAGTSITTM